MNVDNDGGPFVVFRDSWASGVEASGVDEADTPQTRTDANWADYCRTREQAERAAAKSARSLAARRIHQELAQAYAALLGIDFR